MNTLNITTGTDTRLNEQVGSWTFTQQFWLRAAFIFTLISIIPLSAEYLHKVFQINWSKLTYVDVDLISNYYPWFVDDKGLGTDYAGLVIAIALSLAGALLWTLVDKKKRNYDSFYYWTRVLIRYKIAGVMFYFAFVKVFPVQMPFPSLSQMNTLVGDFTPGRLFWISTGASPFYEVFSGLVELTATVLLLFRRTTTLGALLLIAIMVPVVALNIGYDAGVQVKAILILLLAGILLVENAVQLYNFLILQKTARLSSQPAPVPDSAWKAKARVGLKIAFILFFMVFRGYSVATSFFSGKSYKLPEGVSLPEWRGVYDVKKFELNHQLIPYSTTDSTRWHNIIFERWSTISIKDGRPLKMSVNNSVRKTEVHANGGRRYYEYTADTTKQLLTIKYKEDPSQQLLLHYTHPTDSTIILRGLNEKKDSIYVELQKVNRVYPLIEKKGNFTYTPY